MPNSKGVLYDIIPSKNGGYFIMVSKPSYEMIKTSNLSSFSSSMSDHIPEIVISMEYVNNLDEYSEEEINKAHERRGKLFNKNKHKVYITFEFFDEQNEFIKQQPIELIPFKSGFWGYVPMDYLTDVVSTMNGKEYFNQINDHIIKRSNSELQLLSVYPTIENRKTYKYLVVQFKVAPKPVLDDESKVIVE
jgi:hypothetical protein